MRWRFCARRPRLRGAMEGRTFGDFVLKQRLGAGGGGEVYLAEQTTLGREAVIKVMLRGERGADADQRFLREARLASQLDHPFAAHVYGFGAEADGVLWITMELVRGASLDAVVKSEGAMPLPRFVPFFERLCEVLHAAHEQGIVHRDIKPANVMVLTRSGRLLPKLLDLGIARRDSDPLENALTIDEAAVTGEGSPAETLSGTLASQLFDSENTHLTRVGALVGTPHYMAPEQWVDASSADLRADLYSLSLLAYQALTGKVPYPAKSLRHLARAHSTLPLPPMPDGVPPDVYTVLSKGAAKDPAQRYATALELGAALRAASGIGVEPFALPQLGDALRENLLSHAPQPIAEAVALLESARTPKQQLDAVMMVRRVALRYVATLALASRARVAPGSADDPTVVALLQKLGASSLDPGEWPRLAEALCRPFAARRATHPLPELVTFFFADEAAAPGLGALALTAFDAIEVRELDEVMLQAVLLKLVPALSALLKSLTFVLDYALIVAGDECERWVGARRLHRLVHHIPIPIAPLPAGAPFLVDPSGVPVLTLWPLMQVFSPGAGLPQELFFLDGAGRHGARLVASPGPFERQSDEVWPWFSQYLFDVTLAQEAVAKAERPPYKGLSTFTPDDADNYYGREREAESFSNRLRLTPLLAVVGPSGSGKSSFIIAGVLPLLPRAWRAIVMRPGATPFHALAAKLGCEVDALSVPKLVAMVAPGETVVVVIDQFEELITLCQDAQTREAFAELLVRLADSKGSRFRVVITLRDDFLIKAQQLRALRERLSSALQLLGTPASDDLLRVVTEPAARVGYGFDDATLPAKMVDEVAQYPGALALLSFAASQLWELRDRQLRQMRAKTYLALGGVGGALSRHAEQTLASMSVDEAGLVREAFRHLVTSQATRAVLTRKEMLDVLGGSPAAQSVLEKLVAARLLVTSEDPSGDDRVEIIHEALIVSWPRLDTWLREDAETARLRDSLRASAKQWAELGRPSGLLWRKETLAEYRVWRSRFPGRLTRLELEFAQASLKDESKLRTLRRALAAVAFAALTVGLAVVFRAYQHADASAAAANQRLRNLWQEQGRLAMVGGRPIDAFAYSVAAQSAGASGPELEHVISASASALTGAHAIAEPLSSRVMMVQTDRRGRWVAASTSREVVLLSPDDLKVIHRFELPCPDIALSPSGDRLAMVCSDRQLRVVELPSMAITATPISFRGLTVHFSPDSERLVVGQGGSQLTVRDALGAELYPIVTKERSPFMQGEFISETDVVVYAGSFDPGVDSFRVLELYREGRLLWRLPRKDPVRFVRVSKTKQMLFFGEMSGTIGAVDLATGKLQWEAAAHQRGATAASLDAVEQRVATVGADGALKIWQLASGKLDAEVKIEAGALRCVDWVDSGSVLTAGTDGVVRRVMAASGMVAFSHFGHSGLVSACSMLGERALTGDQSGGIWEWDSAHKRGEPVKTYPEKTIVWGVDGVTGPYATVSDTALSLVLADGSAMAVDPALKPAEINDLMAAPDQRWGVASIEDQLFVLRRRGDLFAVESASPSTHTDSIAFAPDSSKLAVTASGLITVLASDGGVPFHLKQGDDVATSILFDGDTLFTSALSGDVYVWSLRDGKLLGRHTLHGGDFQLVRSVVPGHVLTFGRDRKVTRTSTTTWQPTTEIHDLPGGPATLTESPDGSLLFAVFQDGSAVTYSARTNQRLSQIQFEDRVQSAVLAKRLGVLTAIVVTDGRVELQHPIFPEALSSMQVRELARCRIPVEVKDEQLVRHPLPCAP